jgi:hypothetical protein
MSYLTKIWHLFFCVFKFIWCGIFRIFIKKQMEKRILIDITNRLWINRYLYVFVKFLNLSGYNVSLLCNRRGVFEKYIRFWNRFDNYGRLLLNPLLCSVIFRIPRLPQDYIYMNFEGDGRNSFFNWKCKLILDLSLPPSPENQKKIRKKISFFYDNPHENNNCALLPFFMHPNLYRYKKNREIKKLQVKRRTLSILFAGNIDISQYKKAIYKNMLTRSQIMEHILSHSTKLSVILSSNVKDILQLPTNVFVLIDGKCSKIRQKNWLDFISQSKFFLCPPGYSNPLCHNIIESMAVGTIPLTNYAHFFNPPLENGITCLSFSNLKELENQIRKIFQMDGETVSMMRKNVIEYYDRYLEPHRYIERMFSHLDI